MSKTLWLCATALALSAAGLLPAQAQDQGQTSAQASQKADAPPQDPLVEAARKARQEKKSAPKAAKVFTNDNLPAAGGVSTVGSGETASAQEASGTSTAPAANDEKTWRDKFAALHQKLQQDQAQLDVLQREAGVGMVQYYGGDPQKAAQDQASQQPLGAAYNKKVSKIDDMKKAVEADQQAISEAEDELRKSGGDPGWAR